MMTDRRGRKANRIPVRFVDEEQSAPQENAHSEEDAPEAETDQGELTPEEIGRESAYEGETEVKRRIDRGAEEGGERGRESADESDTAGAPPLEETPERREDQHEASPAADASAAASAEKDEQAGVPPQSMASGPMLAELIATRAELKRVEATRDDLLDRLARRQADFDNYRKRVERERGETYNRVVGEVVSKLLPVVDNLRRALDAEAMLQAGESEEFRHFLNGVELISRQLNGVLEDLGVQPVASVGELFDPHIHEAVATEQTDDYEPDTVMQEMVRGYRLGEKLLRPAMVKVAK
ncbi:MAG: nucleotide exchange factor GrpE [Pyrinomonadaceae bacterium]